MMQNYRKKMGGKAGIPTQNQGGSGGNMATPTKAPPQRQSPIVNMKAPMGATGGSGAPQQGGGQGQPSPQDLQKIFDIARTQGPQAVQQYVAQAHGPQAAAALAAHPAVQQTMGQMAPGGGGGGGGLGLPASGPGGSPGASGPASGAGAPSASAWGGSAGIASPAGAASPAGLAPRYQAMIAAGQDPAAVAARAAQFQAGGLPGQQQPPMGRLSPPGPVGSVPSIPGGGESFGNSGHADPYAPPAAQVGQAVTALGPMQNAGTQIPGVQAPGGAFTKPFQDPNDMRSMIAQRLRGTSAAGNVGYNAGGGNYLG